MKAFLVSLSNCFSQKRFISGILIHNHWVERLDVREARPLRVGEALRKEGAGGGTKKGGRQKVPTSRLGFVTPFDRHTVSDRSTGSPSSLASGGFHQTEADLQN